jgi:hypothetical protein
MTAPLVSRRSVLVGGTALVLASACSGGDDGSSGTTAGGTDAPGTGELTGTLLTLLPAQGVLVTGGEQRLPIALADAEGVPVRDGLEPRQFQIRADTGEPLVIDVEPHGDGVPTPYYPVRFTPEGPGIHELTAVGEAGFNVVTFEVGESTPIPSVGQPLPPVTTPTTAADRGVTPICTRTPVCDLHGTSLDAALEAGGPLVLSISTPEFCQTAICGPVLDLVLEALPDFPSITGVHAEVYADPRGNADPTAGGLAPVTEAYGLPFEPTLYLVDASGTIVERLDSVYDRTELRAALERIA